MLRLLHILLCASLCASCDGNSKMRDMSNNSLSSKHDVCIRKPPASPGRVTACENIRKECERRSSEGNYAC